MLVRPAILLLLIVGAFTLSGCRVYGQPASEANDIYQSTTAALFGSPNTACIHFRRAYANAFIRSVEKENSFRIGPSRAQCRGLVRNYRALIIISTVDFTLRLRPSPRGSTKSKKVLLGTKVDRSGSSHRVRVLAQRSAGRWLITRIINLGVRP